MQNFDWSFKVTNFKNLEAQNRQKYKQIQESGQHIHEIHGSIYININIY